MPSILLINENKIVSRLLQLSSQKQGYEIEELNNLGASGTSYDVIFVDSDLYNDEMLQNIKSKFTYNHLGFIGAKKDTLPEGFDLSIEKPFLPTDFVGLIKQEVIDSVSKPLIEVDDAVETLDDELDLDDETELLLNDDEIELDTLDELDELEDDVDLSLDSSSIMNTGIVDKMSNADSGHEELANMLTEIDEMDTEELNLGDDIELQELETVEEETNYTNVLELEIDDEPKELETIEESSQEELDSSIATTGVGVAAAAVGIVSADMIGEDKKEEAIMNDFENLDESQIKDALSEEEVDTSESLEEIVSEELDELEASETTVESNDVEQWIRDAVAKAITPDMIKEALNGMDVSVTLSFNSKKED
jgi:uncharacterized membrane protein